MPTTIDVDASNTAPAGTGRVDIPTAADEHALIMCGAEVFLPSGQRMKWPAPDSVERLAAMIEWAWSQRPPAAPHTLLQPRGGCPQLWIVGEAALDRLGWLVELPAGWEHMSDGERRDALAESVTARLTASLAPLLEAGWVLRGRDATPGAWIRLKKGSGLVDIVLEPYAWTAERIDKAGVLGIDGDGDIGTGLGEDDVSAAAELGRRLAACVQHLDVLPSLSPARTGAAIADRIWNSRRKRGKGLVIETPGPLPDLEDGPAPHEDLEPPVVWTRHPADLDVAGEVAPMVEVVELDQRRAYLASTAIDLGYGTPKRIAGEAAADVIGRGWAQSSPKTPFGLARVWLPAGEEIAAPEWMPLPHPLMAPDRRVQAWVTTRSVKGLCDPVASGGAGVELDDLEIEQAWMWPQQGRVLDGWTKVLREAGKHFAAAGDQAMDDMVKAIYAMYVGRMHNPDLWTADPVAHHHQPVWRAFVMAETRWRNRSHAAEIHRRYGLKPLQTATDSWIYALRPVVDADHPDAGPLVPNLGDETGRNGKLKIETRTELTSDLFWPLIDALTAAQRPRDVADALTAALTAEEH